MDHGKALDAHDVNDWQDHIAPGAPCGMPGAMWGGAWESRILVHYRCMGHGTQGRVGLGQAGGACVLSHCLERFRRLGHFL